jgi:hypothetical protein
MKAHGATKRALELNGADPNKDDVEGTANEDSWLSRGSHGWFDRLRQRLSHR